MIFNSTAGMRYFFMQIGGPEGAQYIPQDLEKKCSMLRQELCEVIAERRENHIYSVSWEF